MKHILCYGDSNTWGCVPKVGGRYDLDHRWTGLLQRQLGAGYRVIEEGLNGRTTLWEDTAVPARRNGMAWLPTCLDSHRPLDLVVLMLGTNDLKTKFSLSPAEIAFGAARLVKEILSHKDWGPDGVNPPQVLMISPIHTCTEMPMPHLETFGNASHGRSLLLAEEYRRQARALGCHYFDASTVAEPSPLDGLHLDEEGHRALAQALTQQVREILG